MITIVTPTYNRGYILDKAFQSLCTQTSFAFEWIIVDDGSADNTEEIVKGWLAEELPFSLRYYKQENGGKHRAVNRGVMMAEYDYLLVLDSDDYLEPDAVEVIHKWIATIDGKEGFAGVSGLRGWMKREGAIGSFLKKDYIDALNSERVKYGLEGDKAEVYKTEMLKKYPFPEFEGENFLRESASWDAISEAGYKVRWFNKIIYRCEYLEDGLTHGTDVGVYVKNFQGFTYWTKLQIRVIPRPYRWLKIGYFSIVTKEKGLSGKDARALLDVSSGKFLMGKVLYFMNCILKKIRRRTKL